jgi:8-amino-7-oxononanoate synthase
MDEQDLLNLLLKLEQENRLRKLPQPLNKALEDLSSNDFLKLASEIAKPSDQSVLVPMGSGGSRLLAGNHPIWEEIEHTFAQDFKAPAALFMNSGYAANQSVIASIPTRSDTIFFDARVHTSIREAIRLSHAQSYKFDHLNWDDARHKIMKWGRGKVYIITESVFSMTGNGPNEEELSNIVHSFSARLIVDEAHTTGLWRFGRAGFASPERLNAPVFARIICFGKAYGLQGAMVLGSNALKQVLINVARAFIYTTASSPWLGYMLKERHQAILRESHWQDTLSRVVDEFDTYAKNAGLISATRHPIKFFPHENPLEMQCRLEKEGFRVLPVRPPTVPQAGIRVCLHKNLRNEQIKTLVRSLSEA